MPSLAQSLFEANARIGELESQVNDRLEEIFGKDTWVEFLSVDEYDQSIELKAPARTLILGKHAQAICDLGFIQGWVNFDDRTEQHFYGGNVYEVKHGR